MKPDMVTHMILAGYEFGTMTKTTPKGDEFGHISWGFGPNTGLWGVILVLWPKKAILRPVVRIFWL